jgi:CMP-N-acetylneuraminic acid synthetase
MQNQYKVLAVIPARGGSKGVKNKNIRLIGGKPLIYWSILEASKSKLISEFYVSTDSKDIQKISEAYKANILLRPSHLADDKHR